MQEIPTSLYTRILALASEVEDELEEADPEEGEALQVIAANTHAAVRNEDEALDRSEAP